MAKEHAKLISNWKHQVKFVVRVRRISGSAVRVSVKPEGPPKSVKIWWWNELGTPAHIIVPRAKKSTGPVLGAGRALRFKTGYIPKTTPTSYGGPGRATGGWVFTDLVRHPGTKPRHKRRHVNRKTRRKVDRVVRKTLTEVMVH